MTDRSALLKDISEMIAAGVADDLSSDEIAGNVMVIIDTAELLANSRPSVTVAQRARDAWCEGDTPPAVKPGHEREFVVAVRRAHSGKVYSFAASYLNAAPLRYDYCPKDKDGFCEECSDDGCPTTGWFIRTGDDDGTQYNRLHLDKGDEFMGWREIPRWEDRASLPEGQSATAWKCLARCKAACAWPDCGCDPEATKVIAALVEQGWQPPDPTAQPSTDRA